MLRYSLLALLTVMTLACGCVNAADEGKKPESEAAAMKALVSVKKVEAAPLVEQTWKGLLGSSSAGAEATLQVATDDKSAPAKKLQLYGADATVSAQIAELLKLKPLANVTGYLAADNVSVKVIRLVKLEMPHRETQGLNGHH